MYTAAMNFAIISIFPDMFSSLEAGMPAIAKQKGLMQYRVWNPRDFSDSLHRNVDDRPYGGGPGMVMQYQPLRDTILAAKHALGDDTPVIYLSPQGQVFGQTLAQQQVEQHDKLILLCGRYEGIDERIIEHWVDAEWSVGDVVLSGGEIPAMLVIDAISRLLPGCLGHDESAKQDSFQNELLDHPHYTRPQSIDNYTVPEVLLSGDHAKISAWRAEQARIKTWQKRPDLIKRRSD